MHANKEGKLNSYFSMNYKFLFDLKLLQMQQTMTPRCCICSNYTFRPLVVNAA